MELLALIGGGTGIAAAAGLVGRWLGIRSSERRDLMQQALERVAHLEGRSDVLQSQLGTATQQLSDERVSHEQRIGALTLEIEQLRGQTEQLRGRIAQLEEELDEARRENARLRGLAPPARRPTPASPIEAQPGTDDAPPRR